MLLKTSLRRKKKKDEEEEGMIIIISISRSRHNKHWPAYQTVLPSLFWWPKKGHTVRQM